MNLGEKIYQLRAENNMSQGDLASALDVSRQSISKWETNTSVPGLDKLVRLSEVFNISLDELMRGQVHEPLATDSREPAPQAEKNGLPPRKIVGLILLGIGLIVFLLFGVLMGPLAALVFCSPLIVCGVICLTIKKHSVLWCCWAVYLMTYAYLRVATGIRFWWAFIKAMYRSGMESHLIIAWAMTLGVVILVIVTAQLLMRKKKKRPCL